LRAFDFVAFATALGDVAMKSLASIRRLGLTAILVLVGLCGSAFIWNTSLSTAESDPASLRPAPLEVVGANATNLIDLGRLDLHAPANCCFSLKNVTDRPVSFKVSTSCGCSKVTPKEGIAAPGETFVLTADVTPKFYTEKRLVNLSVIPADASVQSTDFVVTYSCPTPILVLPSHLTVEIPKASPAKKNMPLKIEGSGRVPVARESIAVTTSNDWISASFEQTGTLIVGVDPSRLPSDISTGSLTIKHLPANYSVDVPITCRKTSPFLVVPGHILFREGSSPGPCIASILVRTADLRDRIEVTTDCPLIELRPEQSFRAESSRQTTTSYRVLLTRSKGDSTDGSFVIRDCLTRSHANVTWHVIN
jgi:hypothetical protein